MSSTETAGPDRPARAEPGTRAPDAVDARLGSAGPLDLHPERFRALGHALVDRIAEAMAVAAHRRDDAADPRTEDLEGLRAGASLRVAGPDDGGDAAGDADRSDPFAPTPLPRHGRAAEAVLAAACARLLRDAPPAHAPRQFGYITPAPAPLGVLAELLAAARNANLSLRAAAPLECAIEDETLRWLGDLVGYPAEGGLLTSGGTMANLVGLLAARHGALRGASREAAQPLGTAGAPWPAPAAVLTDPTTAAAPAATVTGPAAVAADACDIEGALANASPVPGALVLYAADTTHGWLGKALQAAGLPASAWRRLPSDAQGRCDIASFAAQVEADRAHGLRPFLAIGNAGTVSTGAVDALPAMAAVCRRHGLWFHVDGAYGAPAACLLGSPAAHRLGEAADGLAGLAEADSLALDPHKWLAAPLGVGALLVRDAARLREPFGQQPPYYAATAPGAAASFHELGLENTRPFRALKVWMALQMAGRDGVRALIDRDIAHAQRLAEAVQAQPRLELVTQALGIVTLRWRSSLPRDGAADAALHHAWLARLQADAGIGLSPARVGTRPVLRACFINFHTTAADVDRIVPALVAAGEVVEALETARSPGTDSTHAAMPAA